MNPIEDAFWKRDLALLRAALDQAGDADSINVGGSLLGKAADAAITPEMLDLLIERGVRLEALNRVEGVRRALQKIYGRLCDCEDEELAPEEREQARIGLSHATDFLAHLVRSGATREWTRKDWQHAFEHVTLSEEGLDALVRGGADVSAFGDVMLSTSSSDEKLSIRLLELGASPTVSDSRMPIVQRAVQGGQLTLVERMLAGGADANAVGSFGITALMDAARIRPEPWVRSFSAKQFSDNLPGLRMAMIDLLVRHGARLDTLDEGGRGVTGYAQDEETRGHLETLGAPRVEALRETNVVVIQAADRTVELVFEDGDPEWSELVGSGEAVTGIEPKQVQEGTRRVARIVAQQTLVEVIRIVQEDAGLVNQITLGRLRALI